MVSLTASRLLSCWRMFLASSSSAPINRHFWDNALTVESQTNAVGASAETPFDGALPTIVGCFRWSLSLFIQRAKTIIVTCMLVDL